MKRNLLKSLALVMTLFLSGIGWGQITTYTYTGSVQTYVVPAGVSLINVQAYGASGGTATNDAGCGGIGGRGGYAEGDLTVTPGETLFIYVGGVGLPGNAGGWNGAGVACANTSTCATGGGSSDVRQGGTALTDRVIVAGGGGGAEWSGCSGGGGDGGGLDGEGGAHPSYGGRNGGGGTQFVGGAAGIGGYSGFAGSFGIGGNSGSHPAGHSASGGGGWYGGGGSAEDGHAGGGSSYITGLAGATTAQGVNIGHGEVIIEVLCDGLVTSISATEVCEGDEVTLEATSTNGGTITWDGGVTDGVAFEP
ncbi:MAG: glycine-rich protein, partial [Crocinitomicaceae bacterium]